MNRSCLNLFAILALSLSAQSTLARVPNWGLEAVETTQARTIASPQQPIIVAVIDTGADINHPDLADNLWENPGEVGVVDSQTCQKTPEIATSKICNKSINGIDDDGNGYVDDVNGWNFLQGNASLHDRHGHGTHVAGIISSIASPNVKLMILKYFDPMLGGKDPLRTTIQAIKYATRMGAHVINYSAGGLAANNQELEAIREAGKNGILFVAAAGNEASNSDVFRYYPADYALSNILSVTAFDPDRKVLPSSNFGKRTVHLAAPGEEIVSALPGGKSGSMTGTSQATAFASGAAALLLSSMPGRLAPEYLIERLVQSGQRLPSLAEKTKYRTGLSAYRALLIRNEGLGAFDYQAGNTSTIDPKLFAPSLE